MDKLIELAVELQALSQAGLEYSKDNFDIERFTRIREISAEIISLKSELSLEKVTELFCNETGYQTPKIDTRAVIFKDDKILLVKEALSNDWSLPGGWMDVGESLRSNIVKEVKEEAGLDVTATRVIAIHDRDKHNEPKLAHKVCKIFVLCDLLGGSFEANTETIESGFFSLSDLPKLSETRNTKSQIELCFKARSKEHWDVEFD